MDRHEFVHESRAARVVFGAGALKRLPEEIERLGARRALVLCRAAQRATAEQAAAALGARAAGVFAQAAMHVPTETAGQARKVARELGADCAVAVGGGSTIGLGKAIALDSGLPIVAVPTPLAGSEMTPIFGLTDAGLKKTGRDSRVLPRTVVYDPLLLLSLPAAMLLTSGLNAIAHGSRGAAGPGALWRVAVRLGAGHGHDGAASQALPHAGRHPQPAACRDACGDGMVCRIRCARSACLKPRSTVWRNPQCKAPIRTLGRWSKPRSARCSSAPTTARPLIRALDAHHT